MISRHLGMNKGVRKIMTYTLAEFLNGEEPAIPLGWKTLFSDMCGKLKDCMTKYKVYAEDLIFLYIKEKFGELDTMLAFPTDNEEMINVANEIIENARNISGKTCHICGNPAKVYSRVYILPHCEKCAKKYCDVYLIDYDKQFFQSKEEKD